jgi:hypothetical protein
MLDNPYTTEALLASVEIRGYFPVGTGLTQTQLLQLLSEEQHLYLTALLKSIREEFLVTTVDIAVDEDDSVQAPGRAAGGAFRTVQFVPSDGGAAYSLPRFEPEGVPEFGITSAASPSGYVFQGNTISFVPSGAVGTLRLAYQQRLSRLVLPDACARIESVAYGVSVVVLTVDQTPSDFADADATVDIVRGTPNFTTRAIDLTPGFPDTDEIAFYVADVGLGIAAGDYVCLAGTTPIPQLPVEAHHLLAQKAALAVAESIGSPRAQMLRQAFMQAEADIKMLLSPRSDGNARPIVSRYGAGWGG